MWVFAPCELCSEDRWELPMAILEVCAWLEVSSFSLCPERFSNSEVVPWLPSAFRIKLKLLLMASENIQNLVSGSSQLVFLFALPFILSTTNMLFPLFLRLANHIPISGLCACCPLSLDVYFLKVSPQGSPYHRNLVGQRSNSTPIFLSLMPYFSFPSLIRHDRTLYI